MTAKGDDVDPEDDTIFAALRTLHVREAALFLGAIITSLVIWLIFMWVHRGAPSGP